MPLMFDAGAISIVTLSDNIDPGGIVTNGVHMGGASSVWTVRVTCVPCNPSERSAVIVTVYVDAGSMHGSDDHESNDPQWIEI